VVINQKAKAVLEKKTKPDHLSKERNFTSLRVKKVEKVPIHQPEAPRLALGPEVWPRCARAGKSFPMVKESTARGSIECGPMTIDKERIVAGGWTHKK